MYLSAGEVVDDLAGVGQRAGEAICRTGAVFPILASLPGEPEPEQLAETAARYGCEIDFFATFPVAERAQAVVPTCLFYSPEEGLWTTRVCSNTSTSVTLDAHAHAAAAAGMLGRLTAAEDLATMLVDSREAMLAAVREPFPGLP